MREIKILTISILALMIGILEGSAQQSASELFKAYSMSIMMDSLHQQTESEQKEAAISQQNLMPIQTDSASILDSLMREENRYHIPISQIRFTETLERQIQQGDSMLEVMSEQMLPFRGRREMSDIMRYYARYDVMKNRVYPEPPRDFSNISQDEYPPANPLFMPLVFDAFKEDMDMPEIEFLKDEENYYWFTEPEEIAASRYVHTMRKNLMHSIEREQLSKFDYCYYDIPAYERIDVTLEAKRPIQIDARPNMNINVVRHEPMHRIDPEYTYWRFRGRMSTQMTQTYISQNWSSGGESNMSGLFSLYWKANYDDKKNIQFDNFIDWKIGMNTNSGDTLRGYNISTDQLQAVSKLGIKAVKNWYYSAQAEFITQTLTNYKTNTYTPKSSFLSPAKLFVSLGMDFKKTSRNNQHKISVLMTPLTYRMNFLMDTINFNPSSYGIDQGKRIGHEFGFKVTANYDWKISEDISWNSYLYYYSDFSYIDSEWKNTVNFKVNQYLSTQLFIHTKLNDREFKRGEGKKLVQLKEFLSFGVTYFW